MHHKLLIIGAGAAGLVAAVTAKDQGIDAAILERNDRIGKKILMTGDGRCNITNESTATGAEDELAALSGKFHSNQAGFPVSVLKQLGIRQTIDFFSGLGLPLTKLKEGMMYPMSLQAASVLDIFQLALEDRDVPVYFNTIVEDVIVRAEHPRFTVVCKVVTEEVEEQAVYTSDYLFLCTGGLTAPSSGTDGSGYTLAAAPNPAAGLGRRRGSGSSRRPSRRPRARRSRCCRCSRSPRGDASRGAGTRRARRSW